MPANIPSTVSLSVSNLSGGLSWTYNGTTSTDFSVNTSGSFSYGKTLVAVLVQIKATSTLLTP